MQRCPNCGHTNRAGIVFCENCGASLIGKMPLDTKSLDSSSEEERAEMGIDSSVLADVKVQGVATFEEGASLRLELEGSPEPILFKPKTETIFGRRDPATGAMPDIDLTPFAGYRMGVSRRHAAIRRSDDQALDLWDLGSSNGTYLNGQRLSAHRPYRLHDGDELRLGQMMIRIYFQPVETAEVSVASKPTVETTEIPRPEREGAKAEQEAVKPADAPKPAPAEVKPEQPAEAPKSAPAGAIKPAEPAKPAIEEPQPTAPEIKPAEAPKLGVSDAAQAEKPAEPEAVKVEKPAASETEPPPPPVTVPVKPAEDKQPPGDKPAVSAPTEPKRPTGLPKTIRPANSEEAAPITKPVESPDEEPPKTEEKKPEAKQTPEQPAPPEDKTKRD
jgi:hypothetical protein